MNFIGLDNILKIIFLSQYVIKKIKKIFLKNLNEKTERKKLNKKNRGYNIMDRQGFGDMIYPTRHPNHKIHWI